MNRRLFLYQSLQLIGLYGFSQIPGLARAQSVSSLDQSKDGRFLIGFRVPGGIDTMMSSDPFLVSETLSRKTLPFPSSPGDNEWWRIIRDSDLINIENVLYGPAILPMKDLMKDVAVVNGIVMLPKDVTHPNNLKLFDYASITSPDPVFNYFARAPSSRSDLVISNTNFDKSTLLSVLGKNLFSTDSQLSDFAERQLENVSQDGFYQNQRALVQARRAVENFQRSDNRSNENSTKVIKPASGDVLDQILTSFATGLSSVAVFNYKPKNINLDTHKDHDKYHLTGLKDVFQTFANLIRTLKATPYSGKKSFFDVTTIVLYNEFARSAWREKESGTQHNPMNNSVWLAGGNIKGGIKVGASSIIPAQYTKEGQKSSLHAHPYNFDEGTHLLLKDFASIGTLNMCARASDKRCWSYITPTTIWATVAASMGIKDSPWTQYPILNNLIKS